MDLTKKIANDDFLKQVKIAVGIAVVREMTNPDQEEAARHMEVLSYLTNEMCTHTYGRARDHYDRGFTDLMIYLFCIDPGSEQANKLREMYEPLEKKFRQMDAIDAAMRTVKAGKVDASAAYIDPGIFTTPPGDDDVKKVN